MVFLFRVSLTSWFLSCKTNFVFCFWNCPFKNGRRRREKKKQYQLQMVWYWWFAHCVNILLSFWRYVQMYFYSMVCVNMSQLEPKPKRKGDIICKVTMYSQLTTTISILYIWLEPGIRSYIKHGNCGTSSPDWVSHLFGFSLNVHPWRLFPL